VLVLSTVTASPAHAQSTNPVDERAERLTNLMLELLPFGYLMEQAAANEPTWPLMKKASNVNAEQLACVRGELSAAGYRRAKLKEARAYVVANPSRFEGDVAVLEEGAAKLVGKLMLAGFDAARSGGKVDPAVVMKTATSGQLIALSNFMYDPKYEPLRNVAGVGDAFSGKSGEESQKRGEGLGLALMSTLTLKALDACQVPPSVIF
jgi:hypothetical protein